MKTAEHETYLGDVICSSGKSEKNISIGYVLFILSTAYWILSNKANYGVGAISQIFSMLSQVSLGHFYFEIALIMRDSSQEVGCQLRGLV